MRLASCDSADKINELLRERKLDGILALPSSELKKNPAPDNLNSKGLHPAYTYNDADIFYVQSDCSNILWLALDDEVILHGGLNEFRPCLALKIQQDGTLAIAEKNGKPWVQAWTIQLEQSLPEGLQTKLSPQEQNKNPTARARMALGVAKDLDRSDMQAPFCRDQENSQLCAYRGDIVSGMDLARYMDQRNEAVDFLNSSDVEQVWRRLSTMCRTTLQDLQRVHALGLVHRDPTDSNIIIDYESDCECSLIDFETAQKSGHAVSPETGKLLYFPPEAKDAQEDNVKVKLRCEYDYYIVSCVLGMVLVNEFRESKLELVESFEHQAMLGAMVASIIDKVIEPMSVHKPSARQSVSASLKQLDKLDREFEQWFAAKANDNNYSTTIVVRQPDEQRVVGRQSAESPRLQIAKLKSAAISKLRRYYYVGRMKKILSFGFTSRRFLQDADRLLLDCKKTNCENSGAVKQLLIQWRVLILLGNSHRQKSAFRDAFNQLLEGAAKKYGDEFTIENIDNVIKNDRGLVKQSALRAKSLFTPSARFDSRLAPKLTRPAA